MYGYLTRASTDIIPYTPATYMRLGKAGFDLTFAVCNDDEGTNVGLAFADYYAAKE